MKKEFNILKGRAAASPQLRPSAPPYTGVLKGYGAAAASKAGRGPSLGRGEGSDLRRKTSGGRGGESSKASGEIPKTQRSSKGRKFPPKGESSLPPPKVPNNARDPKGETGSGSTKRAAFRKARKGIRNAASSFEWPVFRSALGVLARLQVRWGSSTAVSLGELPRELVELYPEEWSSGELEEIFEGVLEIILQGGNLEDYTPYP